MEKNNPFNILLDQYAEECDALCESLFRKMEPHHLKGKASYAEKRLKRSAFAYLCVDYLSSIEDMYTMDDFDYFIGEAGLINRRDEIFYLIGKENIEWKLEYDIDQDDDGDEHDVMPIMLEELILKYKQWWKDEISNLYKTDMDILELFGESIFKDGGPSGIDVAGKALNFVQENFHRRK